MQRAQVQPDSMLKFSVTPKWQLLDATGRWELKSYSFSENAHGKFDQYLLSSIIY